MKFKILLISVCLILLKLTCQALPKDYTLTSPNTKLKMQVRVDDSITYSVYLNNNILITPSTIGMTLQGNILGNDAKVSGTKSKAVNSILHPLYGKEATLTDNYNELVINFEGNYSLVLRVYNEGVAYRFVTNFNEPIIVVNEKAQFNFSGSPEVIFPETDNYTAWEVPYVSYNSITAIGEGKKAITPTLFSYPQSKTRVIVAEADLLNYPGMYVKKQNGKLIGNWAKYPAEIKMGSWGDFVMQVAKTKDYISDTDGSRAFPWRVIIAADDDKTLLNNQLVYKLATPAKLTNTAWIKPGKAAWEWWHDAMLPGSSIPSGMGNRNTKLYKYYIDFAANNNLQYLMIDAGWSDNYDLLKVNPKVDVKELIAYGKSKKVGVFLWCVASTLIKNLDANLDFLQSIGAVGVKVDFFDRDDQPAIALFEEIAKAAGKRNLMVNFHGCSKPTGLQRAYPNIVNYEAVRGAECSKWDYSANPDHHLLIPFIRMIAGPMDYTPGSMRNRSKESFKPVDPGLPSSQGTRCHELAMFVVYDQPLAMLSDSPTEYEKYPDIMKFLGAVPTVFEETKVLDAKVGEYAVMAKKQGNTWFIGAMTNWEARTVELDFSFLTNDKTYTVDLYTDASDANTNAEHYEHKTIQVTKKTKLQLSLAKGGGAVAYLKM
jgi:alpha-glucosidase